MAMGLYLTKADIAPALALCSTATRAKQTWEILSNNWPAAPDVAFEDGLYLAGASNLLIRLKQLKADLDSVMIIGHNPDIEMLIRGVARTGQNDAMARAAQKVPTCAFAEISIPINAWSDLEPGTATLEKFVIPGDLA